MPALVAGIHAVHSANIDRSIPQNRAIAPAARVDGRHKAGHDGEFASRHPTLAATASRNRAA